MPGGGNSAPSEIFGPIEITVPLAGVAPGPHY